MDVNKLSLRKKWERVVVGGVAEGEGAASRHGEVAFRGLTRSVIWTKSPRRVYRPEINSICTFQTKCEDLPPARRPSFGADPE